MIDKLYIIKIETRILGTLYVKYDGHVTNNIDESVALEKDYAEAIGIRHKIQRQVHLDFDTVEDLELDVELVEVNAEDYPIVTHRGNRKECTNRGSLKYKIQELENEIEVLRDTILDYETNIEMFEDDLYEKERELEELKTKLEEE